MRNKIRRFFKLVDLGYRTSDKWMLGCIYIFLVLRNRVGVKSPLKYKIDIMLEFQDHPFPFVFESLIDIDLIGEIFITQIYATDTPPSATVIFDIGSNKGASVVYFAILFPKATIYAFEPDPRNVATFRRVTASFRERIILYEKAVMQSDEEIVTLYYSDSKHWSSSIYQREKVIKSINVKSVSIDSVVEKENIHNIDLLKFDIEGAEYEVFSRCSSLSVIRRIAGELHPDINKSTRNHVDDIPQELQKCFNISRTGKNIIKGINKSEPAS